MLTFKFTILSIISTFWVMNAEADSNLLNINQKPKIAIVIDDLGDNLTVAKKIIALPAKLTISILPQTPQAIIIAELANEKGHEIILHLPMEAHTRPDLLGPGALFSNMDFDTFLNILQDDIESIPYIAGFNNHMGSLLTEDKEKMGWVMDEVKNHSLYFLDSRTSQNSIARDIAAQKSVRTIERDIFLDHSILSNDMMLQLKHLKFIAKTKGQAVLICHPYPATLAFLKSNLNSLKNEFELVKLSQLLKN